MLVVVVILSSIALAICTAIKPIFLQNAIDMVNLRTGNIFLYFSLYALSIVGILLFEAIRQLGISRYRTNKVFMLKKKVMTHICYMSPQSFQEENGQSYITILNKEIDMLADSYYVTRLEFAYSVLVLISSIVALLYIDVGMALIIIISTICPILASVMQGKSVEKKTNIYTKALEDLNVMIGNLIHGYSTIKVNHAENEYLQILNQSNGAAAHTEFAQSKTKVRVNMVIGLLAYVGEAVLVGVSIYRISIGTLSVGALVGALQLSEMLAIPTNSISYQLSEMKSVKGIHLKINQLMAPPETSKTKNLSQNIETIELRDVTFYYQDKCILFHVNYQFEAGKKYLILGENGTGKSTLFKLLSGLEMEYSGQILINGEDVRYLYPELYAQIGIVLQDAFMFDDTLTHNITLYRSELEGKVESVMNFLGMDAFLKLHDLNQNFQATKNNLSGGEKQKIALARVLVQDKKVVLLDEVTAGMDKESSQEIMSGILRMADKTIISIEHKVNSDMILLYDKILELKDFRLEERM